MRNAYIVQVEHVTQQLTLLDGEKAKRNARLLQATTENLPIRPPLYPPFLSNQQFHQLALISPMLPESASVKRPTCPSCSKPAAFCLCSRLRTPILHNSVAVTIFQHSLEKKHPLNSTRIAKIGLKNVNVVTVSDVNFQAQFSIRSLDSSCGDDGSRHMFDGMPSEENDDEYLETVSSGLKEWGADKTDLDGCVVEFNGAERCQLCPNVTNLKGSELSAINFTIGKYGAISSFSYSKEGPDIFHEMGFDQLLASGAAVDEIRKGFVVKKLQMKQLEDESEEFEVAVPCGSVLLFPSERSVAVEAVNCEVKNLIVLDGTWAKAKRMYNENPWLRVLPHIRLNSDKLSLYREVRVEPRAGYLSTIESIVYAMKAVGGDADADADGLDGLLEVFESMVGDQRRCKNQRLSRVSEV